jgi:putative transposase
VIGSKKNLDLPLQERRALVEPEGCPLSITKQCELLGLCRSSYYYSAIPESQENLCVMDLIDRIYTATPFYGSRRMVVELRNRHSMVVNRKRVQRLMRLMRLEAIYPKPRLTQRNQQHKIYPYLLRDVGITRINQVWSTDITYIRLRDGFLYLTAIIDWYSRYVLAWEISNTLDTHFCVSALEQALLIAKPEIFNSDQGCQFTSNDFTSVLLEAGVAISMNGKGRCLDNIICERLWRTAKYEEVYLKNYDSGAAAFQGLRRYFPFYNNERPHEALGYQTPASVYLGSAN